MVLATPFEYELNSSNFSFDKLKDQSWIAREEGSGTREFMDMFLNNNKIIPKNIITFGSNYAVKEAVRNGIGITIISDLVTSPAVKNNEISVIDCNSLPSISISSKGKFPLQYLTEVISFKNIYFL